MDPVPICELWLKICLHIYICLLWPQTNKEMHYSGKFSGQERNIFSKRNVVNSLFYSMETRFQLKSFFACIAKV